MQTPTRVAVITGAARGLGAATALELARRGRDIAVNDLNLEGAEEIAKQVRALGRKAIASQHDVSDHAAAQELVSQVVRELGSVDILVNNAGITRDSMLHKLGEKDWDDVIRVNLKGPFNMGQACARPMMERKYGRIVNLASVAWLGNVGQTNYSASKAGVVGMTRTWAIELARHGITCNAIAPGLIDSALTQAIPQEIKDKFIQRIPLKRIGAPQDVAELVAFLSSDAASYITGQCIQIDGGLSTGISIV